MTGADVLVEQLTALGVTTVFCITGAGNLAVVDAIHREGSLELVFLHHEQAVVMAAQGYARVSGKTGVALVTTGGGAANAVTGALSAQLDSVPILLIAGNESSFHCRAMADFRAFGVQGFDAVSVYRPITKFAERIESAETVARTIQDAWTAAVSGRQGVALIDFPMDLQRRAVDTDVRPLARATDDRSGVVSARLLAPEALRCANDLERAERPLFYFGNGLRTGVARDLALQLAERYRIPFLLSWSGVDLIEDAHPLNMGRAGIYGDRAGNFLLQRCDLLICVGTRLAIPQVGYDQPDFARGAERWVVDLDAVELQKFVGPRWNLLHADATDFLTELTSQCGAAGVEETPSQWLDTCDAVWAALPRGEQCGPAVSDGFVHSVRVMEHLNEALDDDSVVVTDVGAGLLSGHYALRAQKGQRIFTSQGLGEMGFGLPAAIGAHFADRDRQLVCLSTDGGMMFNLQELQTVKHHNMPMKLLVFNNSGYAMIRISQDTLFESRLAGVNAESGVSFPDFADLARTFGMQHVLIDDEAKFDSLLTPALQSAGPVLIEIKMAPDQRYLPRLATRKLADGSLSSPPLEDLDPYLSIEELERMLGSSAHPNSYTSRGLSDG